MKDLFPGYYQRTEGELDKLWSEATFVFDTNVLLNLYRYSPDTSKEFLGILEKLAEQERLWIPYQVASEYQKHRLFIANEVTNTYEQIKNHLDAKNNEIRKIFGDLQNRIQSNLDSLFENLDGAIEQLKDEIETEKQAHLEWLAEDELTDKLAELFKNRVGASYSFDELKEKYSQGGERFKKFTPPGYADMQKGGTAQYSDFIIWSQIINFTKINKKPVIFVTDDQKEDWWTIVGEKRIGPRSELIIEMTKETSQEFHMYVPDRDFLEEARQKLSVQITDDALEEVETTLERYSERSNFMSSAIENIFLESLEDQIIPAIYTEELLNIAKKLNPSVKSFMDIDPNIMYTSLNIMHNNQYPWLTGALPNSIGEVVNQIGIQPLNFGLDTKVTIPNYFANRFDKNDNLLSDVETSEAEQDAPVDSVEDD
ncbi:MAG: PIN domain-containing protein [Aggregatilineales bacterium]